MSEYNNPSNLEQEEKNQPKWDRNTTLVFPRELAGKFSAQSILKIGALIGGLEKITRRDWKKFENEGIAEKVKYSPQEIKEILSKKTPCRILEIEELQIFLCSWCTSQTYITHSHHYPIPQKDGGKETIDICASCHAEWHFLIDRYHYKIKDYYKNKFLDCYKEFYAECDKEVE